MTKPSNVLGSADLAGFGRLATDAIAGLTDVVEALHGQIASSSRGLGPPSAERSTSGITGLVYNSIRGVTRLVDRDLTALAPLAPLADEGEVSPKR